jgi:hypothetical protein
MRKAARRARFEEANCWVLSAGPSLPVERFLFFDPSNKKCRSVLPERHSTRRWLFHLLR